MDDTTIRSEIRSLINRSVSQCETWEIRPGQVYWLGEDGTVVHIRGGYHAQAAQNLYERVSGLAVHPDEALRRILDLGVARLVGEHGVLSVQARCLNPVQRRVVREVSELGNVRVIAEIG